MAFASTFLKKFQFFPIFLKFFELLACFPLSRKADCVFDSKWQHIWTTLDYADMIRGLILRVPKRPFLCFWGPLQSFAE